jgi:hypothetical protein
MKRFQTLSLVAGAAMLMMGSCKPKDSDYHTDPEYFSHFANRNISYFYVQNVPNATFKIPIGITTPVAHDTKVTVSVSSNTGAAAGVQYNLPKSEVTIPAGQTTDSLVVQGIFAGFPGNRVDTLLFKITGLDAKGAPYNDSLKLVMQKYCTVDLTAFAGTYNNVMDVDASGPYGPYTMTVSPVTAANYTSATTGFLMLNNLWDVNGPTAVRVDLDWTDPGNFKTSIPTGQDLYVHTTYGQAKVRPVGTGTFSSCNGTLQLKYQVYVNAGSFAATTTTMAR